MVNDLELALDCLVPNVGHSRIREVERTARSYGWSGVVTLLGEDRNHLNSLRLFDEHGCDLESSRRTVP